MRWGVRKADGSDEGRVHPWHYEIRCSHSTFSHVKNPSRLAASDWPTIDHVLNGIFRAEEFSQASSTFEIGKGGYLNLFAGLRSRELLGSTRRAYSERCVLIDAIVFPQRRRSATNSSEFSHSVKQASSWIDGSEAHSWIPNMLRRRRACQIHSRFSTALALLPYANPPMANGIGLT